MKYIDPETGEAIDFQWKTPYNHVVNDESLRTGLKCEDPSLAQQNQEAESNINTIVGRFLKTGLLPQIQLPPLLEDFADVFDFQSAMNTMAAAKHSFMQLPADIRSAFQNDPHNFVSQIDAMLADTDAERRKGNMAVLRAMGLAVEAGPVADQTTLGDVLAAIKKQTASGGSPAPETVTTGSPSP